MKALEAVGILRATPQHAAKPMVDAIMSAVANATQKQAAADSLKIAAIDVMGGPALKRWHAASKGMAHPFKKRMSHIKVILTDGVTKVNTEEKKEVIKGGK